MLSALALPNATVPGPLTLLHVTVSVPPNGKPSSVAVPVRLAAVSNVTAWCEPALTTGAWFCPVTVIVTLEPDDNTPSLAVKRNTYVPTTENVAVVRNELGLPNLTVPGPLTKLQVAVSLPRGSPSSVAVPDRFAEAGNVIV